MFARRTIAVFALVLPFSAASALAQPLGTFRWQLQPYCNVITVNVTQQGGIYVLDGTDDRCGGGNQAGSAVGIAYLTPLGLVGFGITTVLPGGTPVHTEATINLASLNGTWRDSAGNNGSFVFTSGTPVPGSPRTVSATGLAAASITNVLIAPNAVTTNNITDATVTTADLASPPQAAFAEGGGIFDLTSTPSVVRSVSITAPSAGRVLVNAQGLFGLNAGTQDYAGCGITTGTTVEIDRFTFMSEATAAAMVFVPFGASRGFNVSAGATTFNLVCYELGGSVNVQYPNMTAIFVP